MQVNQTTTNSSIFGPIKADAGASSSSSGDTSSALPTQTLNQNDFLKLLVAQMQSQDPMNPMSDTQFIAQMATFTQLEQSKEMSSNIQQLTTQQQLLQANDLIGRSVMLQNADGSLASGIVSGVLVNAGVPSVIVNGQSYGMSALLSIAPAPSTPQTQGAQS